MALRVGLGEPFYGLQYKYGNSLCITDDSIILSTILNNAGEYDGYVVIQREAGSVAAEFRFSELLPGSPAVAAVQELVLTGNVTAPKGGTLTLKITDPSGVTYTQATPSHIATGTDVGTAAGVWFNDLSHDAAVTALADLSLDLSVPDSPAIVFTSKNAGFPMTVSGTWLADTVLNTTLTVAPTATPTTNLTAAVVNGNNPLFVPTGTAAGFHIGDKIVILSPSQTVINSTNVYQVQTVDTNAGTITTTTPIADPSGGFPQNSSVYIQGVLTVADVTGVAVGQQVLIGTNVVGTVQLVDTLNKVVTLFGNLTGTYANGAAIHFLDTSNSPTVDALILVPNVPAGPGTIPATDVVCFDYSRSNKTVYCFRKDSYELLALDPYNASTTPIAVPSFRAVSGKIIDIHITNELIYIMDSTNSIYEFNLQTGALNNKFSLHSHYKLKSISGANYTLHDRFTETTPSDVEIVNKLYILCANNELLIYDLELKRITLQTTITSDVEVSGIDFYRTFQFATALDDESILTDLSGTPATEAYDVAFLFSLAYGTSNGEFINRWQYNLFKYVPTTIVMVSGNAIIVPSNAIAIYARGLSDHGEVVNDLPIKFSVTGNAKGVCNPQDVYTPPTRRDGWVPTLYTADANPPIGSSDTITSIIIT
jgi:hypothetical protein